MCKCATSGSMDGHKFKDGQETIITALPMYHIFALTANCVVFFRYGAKKHFDYQPARHERIFCKDLKKNPFTFITGVNTFQWTS